MSDNLLDLLLDRLRATSGNRAIQSFLREVKDERSLKRGELLVSGTKEQLLQHICDAVNHEHIAVRRLATLVAHLEENGGQHIFLFDLTPEGVEALNAESLRLAFPPMADLTPDMYSAKPAQPRIYFQQRSDALVVKQIRTSTFWKKDEERSFDRPTERAVVTVLRESRAVNLFRVCPRDQHAEIRIDRLSGYVRDKDMEEHFLTFLRDLSPVLNPTLHVTPTRIWQGFSDIIRSRDDTFMNTDFAQSDSVNVNISNRRAGLRGQDVRAHVPYDLSSSGYARDTLKIHWLVDKLLTNWDEEDDPLTVHTILSRFGCNGDEYGKVYIGATISPEVLTSVTKRIRSFVPQTP